MWFKQTEQKSPQQPETAAVRPQPAPAPYVAPAAPAEPAPAAVNVAPAAPAFSAGASRITAGLRLKGEISGREDLWIGGSVDGKLRFDTSRVVVGGSGRVDGGIEAREIVIEGKVEGDLRATERLEITQTGRVSGDASAPRLSVQEGAVFNGSIEVGETRSTPAVAGTGSRTAVTPRNPRFQAAQAAGAAAAASAATSPAGSPTGVAGGASSSKESEGAHAGPIAYRGIAADAPERSE